MKAAEIKQELKRKGFTLTLIAEVLGKSPSLMSKVINRSAISRDVADTLSRILERSIDEVFPGLYSTGTPRICRGDQQYDKKIDELRIILGLK